MAGIANFFRMESGSTGVEYGLLIAFIALVVCGAIGYLGKTVVTVLYNEIVTKFPT